MFSKTEKKKIQEYEGLISDFKEKIKDLETELYYDGLTKLKNRKSFKQEIELYESKTKYVLVAISVDLEKVNKTNRENGDAILCSVAKSLSETFSNVYHYSGTKFNVLINLCDFNEDELTKWYESTINKYPDIKIFYGVAKSTDGIGLKWFDIMQIAIKRMFNDKHIKKPENKDIELQLEEKARLEKLKAENEALADETEESAIASAFAKLEAIKQRRDKEKALWESKKKFEANEFHIPEEEGSDVEETEDRKKLCTMWFNKETLAFTVDGQFYEYDFYIFPLSYRQPPSALPIICIIDNRQNYKAIKGDDNGIIKTGIARRKINVSARFDEEGNLISNIVFDDISINAEKTTKQNKALYMPKNWGKDFFGNLVFPIKKNVNGTCDVAMLKGEELNICNGSYEKDNEIYHFTMDSDAIYVNH